MPSLRKATSKPITFDDLQAERVLNIESLKTAVSELHPVVHDALKEAQA